MRRLLTIALAVLLVAAAVPRAFADGDRVAIFRSISVEEGEDVQNAVAVLGSIHSNGPIGQNAVSILGTISLGRDSHVGQNCVAVLGSVRRFSSDQVGQNVVEIPFVIVFIPIFFFIGIVYLIRTLVWRARMPFPMPPPPPHP